MRLKKSNHRTCRFPSAWRCEVQDCRDCAASVERGCGAEQGGARGGAAEDFLSRFCSVFEAFEAYQMVSKFDG